MNILYFGSDELLARIHKQTTGQIWDMHRATDPDQVFDFKGTHVFQGAIFGMCTDAARIRAAARNAEDALDIPVGIGLASQCSVAGLCQNPMPGLDIFVPECGNDTLTKQQCNAIFRFANGAAPEIVARGGVCFHVTEDAFSVNGEKVYLPQKKHKLLELLFLKRGSTVTKEMVFNHLYGWDEPPEVKIVDVFVCQIRKILREAGLKQDCIQTVWGQGYRLIEAAPQMANAAA